MGVLLVAFSYPMTDRETALSSKLSEVEGKLAQALETVATLERENTLLLQKIDLLVRRIFGSKSEQPFGPEPSRQAQGPEPAEGLMVEGLDPAQLLLTLAGMDEPGKAPEPVAGSSIAGLRYSPPPPRRRLRGARRANRLCVSGNPGCPRICRSSRKSSSRGK